MVELFIHSEVSAIPKLDWNKAKSDLRGKWKENLNLVTNWFCISNGLRKTRILNLIISNSYYTKERQEFYWIKFVGKELRYLSPSTKSAASLIWKAFSMKGISDEWKEATPGILIRFVPLRDLEEFISSKNSALIEMASIEDYIGFNVDCELLILSIITT